MPGYPTGPEPSLNPRVTTLKNAGPIVIFAFWGGVVPYWSLYFLVKSLKAQRIKAQTKHLHLPDAALLSKDESVSGTADDFEVKSAKSDLRLELDGKTVTFTGYRDSFFGWVGFVLVQLVSIQWIALYILILWDTYHNCQLSGIDGLCFYGDNMLFGTYLMNGKVFFVTWWLTAIWFTTYVINRPRVRNWFREPAPLQQASHVYVWTPDTHEILSHHVSPIIRIVRRVKAYLTSKKQPGHSETVRVRTNASAQAFFVFEGGRFIISEDDRLFRATISAGNTFFDLHQANKGLDVATAAERLDLVGPNAIPFRADPIWKIALDEMFSLFHVYQLIMYMLQLWNSYLLVAGLDVCIVILSACVSGFTTYRSQKAIEKVTEYETSSEVLRDGKWEVVNSTGWVPGDVIKVKSDWLLPCDLVILEGTCVCNESALTGEAMPVQKLAAPATSTPYDPRSGARYTLFSSTTVLQAGKSADDTVTALVTATGMNTSKGELLSTILYSPQMLFQYDEELPVVVLLLISYAVVCFGISLGLQYRNGSISVWVSKWIYCMAIINQIMSPLLPVALEVGQVHAVSRLKARGIHCLNPKRIAISGKIRLFLFDKTGTLTEDFLQFLGIRTVSAAAKGAPTFNPLAHPEDGSLSKTALHGLATCHAVSKFGDQLVGNQVEVNMFGATGWTLHENLNEPTVVRSPHSADALQIIKVSEFDHGRMTMSVIAKEEATGELHVFCKGSFEKIKDISSPSTLPPDYTTAATGHALDGCYVLGLAHKSLGTVRAELVLQQSREELEANLNFVSLLLFRNELKADSRAAILELKEGQVRPVMATGDNAECGYYISKACGMVDEAILVFLGDEAKKGTVRFTPMGSANLAARSISVDEAGRLELALTGKALRILQQSDLAERLLFATRIFARVTPDQKVAVVDLHRAAGLVVGMCGDGGNDCGALRAAHAGIALSDAEASVVSPFTSSSKSVASTVDLVKEGRAALHTSFACYKFLIIYGLQFSVLKLISYWYGIILCQCDYIMIDSIAVLSLGFSMTVAHPAKRLSKDRPTSSLLGPLNVISVVGVWLINVIFVSSALHWMSVTEGYIKWPAKYAHGASWWTLGDNWESTVVFYTLYFQFISAAFVYSYGSTFRRPVYQNWLIMIVYGGLLVFTSVLLLLPPSGFTDVWHVASRQFNAVGTDSPVWIAWQQAGGSTSPGLSFSFRFRLWWMILGNLLALALFQKVVAEGPISKRVARIHPSKRPKFNM